MGGHCRSHPSNRINCASHGLNGNPNSFNIMATINETAGVNEPRLSTWAKCKRALMNELFGSPNLVGLCCGGVDGLDEIAADARMRRSVRNEMRQQPGFLPGRDCLVSVMAVTLRDDAYDLGDMSLLEEANRGVTRTHQEWQDYFAKLGVPRNLEAGTDQQQLSAQRPAQVVPRFAAAMALHLRAKLGRLAYNEPNLLLVQRKYLEVCKLKHVRDVDTVSHQQFVVNAFFGEDVLDRVGTARQRTPWWVRWLTDQPVLKSAPLQAC